MSNLLEKKNVLRVKDFLKKLDDTLTLTVLDETARTAQDAANSLNVEVGAIVKSLLFKNIQGSKYLLCLVSGDKYVSLEKLSKINNTKIIKTDANECKKFTGFSIGGVSPVGSLKQPNNIFIDDNLNNFKTIYAAAGHPFVVFGTTFKKLQIITKAKIYSIVD